MGVIFSNAITYGNPPKREDDRQIGLRTFQVSNCEKYMLENWASAFSEENIPNHAVVYNTLGNIMGPNLMQGLEDLRNGNCNMVVMENLPTNSVKTSENIALLISDAMGLKCVGSPDVQNGRPIHHITPRQGFEHTSSSSGKNPMSFHTDGSFRKVPFPFLLLYFVKVDPKTSTDFYLISKLLSQLPSSDIDEMQKPHFIIYAPEGATDRRGSIISPLISGDERQMFSLRFPSNIIKNVTPLTRNAKDTLDNINKIMQTIKPSIQIKESGSLVIANNGHWTNMRSPLGFLHGRSVRIEDPNRLVLRGQCNKIIRTNLFWGAGQMFLNNWFR